MVTWVTPEEVGRQWQGQIINHQATDEAVTPSLSREGEPILECVAVISLYQCPMNGPDTDLDTAHSFRPVPVSSA